MRVVSYNIRSGLSSSIDAIGDQLERLEPDVVLLQEVDRGTDRANGADQADELAARLGCEMVFERALTLWRGGEYGIALLSRMPIVHARRVDLDRAWGTEPRLVIDAAIDHHHGPIRVVNVHADYLPWSAPAHARAVADIVKTSVGKRVLVGGDFNATPRRFGPRHFRGLGFRDLVGEHGEAVTFKNWLKAERLDYLFADHALARHAVRAGVVSVDTSDHRPVFADFDL